MSEAEFYSKLLPWIEAATGVPVLQGPNPSNLPAAPHVVATIIGAREIREQSPHVEFDEAEGQVFATLESETEWTVLLLCEGSDPISPLEQVGLRHRIPDAQRALYPLTLHDVEAIERSFDDDAKEWEDRAECRILVRGIASHTLAIDTIETADVTMKE